jgi:hypothetical protein|tara:strand:- start:106 stop:315 length:210 start_codon:yes stop_codon:yes gene_type:complete
VLAVAAGQQKELAALVVAVLAVGAEVHQIVTVAMLPLVQQILAVVLVAGRIMDTLLAQQIKPVALGWSY